MEQYTAPACLVLLLVHLVNIILMNLPVWKFSSQIHFSPEKPELFCYAFKASLISVGYTEKVLPSSVQWTLLWASLKYFWKKSKLEIVRQLTNMELRFSSNKIIFTFFIILYNNENIVFSSFQDRFHKTLVTKKAFKCLALMKAQGHTRDVGMNLSTAQWGVTSTVSCSQSKKLWGVKTLVPLMK